MFWVLLLGPQAKRWIDTIKAHLGHLMGAIRIQCAFRAYHARKVLKRLVAERAAAVKTVRGVNHGSFATPRVCVPSLLWYRFLTVPGIADPVMCSLCCVRVFCVAHLVRV